MESPRMYEEGAPMLTLKNFTQSKFTFTPAEDSDPGLNSLDPTLENVIDLQELINSTIPVFEGEGEPLTIDTIFPACDLDLVETGHTPVLSNINSSDLLKFVPETAKVVCMTNGDEVTAPSTGTGGRQIVTIKSEDLDLTACQGSRASRPTSYSRSSDSFSEASCSSRSSTPDKSSIVYECRKPGRKPSAGGPIRPRKREPTKNTEEYFQKRARNNVAVRKSREKAKLRQGETEGRVNELTTENERLQRKVDLLTKELTVLKSLFINAGAHIPDNFEEILSR